MNEAIEDWKPVVGYEGLYEVSNLGSIRSLERFGRYMARWGMANMRFPAKAMKICETPAGYQYISLSKGGNQTKHLIHRLVAAAFIGVDERQINHIDGDKRNNCVWNLEYCTARENLLHSTRVLKKKIGEKCGSSKLTEKEVIAIRSDNRFLREIAADYGVTLQAIHYIKQRRNWAYL